MRHKADPLVSIIVPTYNGGKYIKSCILSIVNQTYRNIEVIIINDGSTDETKEVCQKLQNDYYQIKVISTLNQGVSKARNTGIDVAAGKYILFVDADDQIDQNYVEYLVMHSDDADLVIGNIETINIGTGSRKKNISDNSGTPKIGKFKDQYVNLQPNLLGPVVKLYKRSILLEKSIYFPVEYSLAEDQMFNFKYYKNIETYYYTPKAIYYYFDYTVSSLSKLRTFSAFCGSLKNLRIAYDFYNQHDVRNKEYLYITHALALINKYAYLKDGSDASNAHNTWSSYKNRVKQILSAIPKRFYFNKKLGLVKNVAWNSIVLFGPAPLMWYCRKKQGK